MVLKVNFLEKVLSCEELDGYKPSYKSVDYLMEEAKDYLGYELLDLKIFHLGSFFVQKDGLHEELNFRLRASLKTETSEKTDLGSWCWFIEVDGYSRPTFKSNIPFEITTEGTFTCLTEVVELMKAYRVILKHS